MKTTVTHTISITREELIEMLRRRSDVVGEDVNYHLYTTLANGAFGTDLTKAIGFSLSWDEAEVAKPPAKGPYR